MRTFRIYVGLFSLLGAVAAVGCNNNSEADNSTDSGTGLSTTDDPSDSDQGSETGSQTASNTEGTGSDTASDTPSNTDSETIETDSCDALLATAPPPAWNDDPISNMLGWYPPVPETDTTIEVSTDTETEATDTETEATDTETEATDTETEATDTETEATDTETVSESEAPLEGGLAGWNILAPSYPAGNALDLLSFEWDYFMIHDKEGRFTGSIGYLIANPRHATIPIPGLSELVPAGGNVAVAGKFGAGSLSANYHNFESNYEASGTRRSFIGDEPESDIFAALVPVPQQEALLLQGQTQDFAWDLVVTQEWPELTANPDDDAFEPTTGRDVGANPALALLGGEVWTVNMLWPRTKVVGTITDISDPLSPVIVEIDGHGYRENSFGRWAFNAGGWDFGIVSDEATRVMWSWQTYHHESTKLDYADVAFYDGDDLIISHFDAKQKEVGWAHDAWKFDPAARQCMPQNTQVLAVNEDYVIEASLTINSDQVPMLSDATSATRSFVIEIQFPMVSGTIKRRSTGETITTFSGQGGGEFSISRQPESVTDRSDDWCYCWGYDKFSSAMPSW